MRLSALQKYILVESLTGRNHPSARTFLKFYERQKDRPTGTVQQDVVTKSLERLVDKELMVGYGRRTPHKWFIDSVKLTSKGRTFARKILQSKQQRLPFSKPANQSVSKRAIISRIAHSPIR